MDKRTEFGQERTTCACEMCVINCRFMPGFLIPADLTRLIPQGVLPTDWAEKNLLASPGALVMQDGRMFRIPTLVPAVKADGSCIHFGTDSGCGIHANAPFGCAFFDHNTPPRDTLSQYGILAVHQAWQNNEIYARIWRHLDRLGKVQQPPDILRERMRQALL